MSTTKNQKIILFVFLPVFFILLIGISYFLFGEKEVPKSYTTLNTSLPSTSSKIETEKINSYNKDADINRNLEKRNRDFILGDYAILTEDEEKKIENKNEIESHKIQKKQVNNNEGESREEELRKAQKILEEEQEVLTQFDENDVYDEERIVAKKKKHVSKKTPPKKKIMPEENPSNTSYAKKTGVTFNSLKLGTTSSQVKSSEPSGILAYIHGEQTVRHGSIVKVRIGQEVELDDGTQIPAHSFLYGTCSITKERLNINIIRAQIGYNIVTCNYSVYGVDGNSGLYVKRSVQKDENKRASGKGLKKIGSVVGSGVKFAGGGVLGSIAETAAEGMIDAVADGTAKSVEQITILLPNNERIFLK